MCVSVWKAGKRCISGRKRPDLEWKLLDKTHWDFLVASSSEQPYGRDTMNLTWGMKILSHGRVWNVLRIIAGKGYVQDLSPGKQILPLLLSQHMTLPSSLTLCCLLHCGWTHRLGWEGLCWLCQKIKQKLGRGFVVYMFWLLFVFGSRVREKKGKDQ